MNRSHRAGLSQEHRPMHMKTRLSFGSAGMAEGIIDCGRTYFVLIYYSQVLGLSATLVSIAIAIGLAAALWAMIGSGSAVYTLRP